MALDTPILFAATADARRARTFYENTLGLQFVSDDPFALVFAVGKLSLRIQKVERPPQLRHTVLGWRVRNIQREVQRLTKAGVRFARYEGLDQDEHGVWQSPSGAKVAWFNDPDGNILSLTELP